eukprot:518498-Rhodomonas_salina.1
MSFFPSPPLYLVHLKFHLVSPPPPFCLLFRVAHSLSFLRRTARCHLLILHSAASSYSCLPIISLWADKSANPGDTASTKGLLGRLSPLEPRVSITMSGTDTAHGRRRGSASVRGRRLRGGPQGACVPLRVLRFSPPTPQRASQAAALPPDTEELFCGTATRSVKQLS